MRLGWIFICTIHNVLGSTVGNSTTDDSTNTTTTAQPTTESSSSTYVVEVVIVGCAILLLLIATMKIGFLLRSSSSQRRREGMYHCNSHYCIARRHRSGAMRGLFGASRCSEVSEHIYLLFLQVCEFRTA